MTSATTAMQFPCDFSIKVMGKNEPTFLPEITTIVQEYYPDTKEDAIRCTMSRENKYCAITVTVHATEQTTLNALYQALSKHPHSHMVL